MKQVTAWEGTDGKLYRTKAECEKMTTHLDFKHWYNSLPNEDQLYSDYAGEHVAAEVLLDWVLENPETLLDILKRINNE